MTISELITKAGLPRPEVLIDRKFMFVSDGERYVLFGKITSVGNANLDYHLNIGVTNTHFIGNLILSINFDGEKWFLVTEGRQYRNGQPGTFQLM